MHRWWNECRWALLCRRIIEDSEEATVVLQFHWLPPTTPKATVGKKWDRPIDLQTGEGKEMVEEWKQQMEAEKRKGLASARAFDNETGRPLQSGHIFEIDTTVEDAWKMREMINLQWACLQIATMSGAAGDPAFLYDSDDDDEDGGLLLQRIRSGLGARDVR